MVTTTKGLPDQIPPQSAELIYDENAGTGPPEWRLNVHWYLFLYHLWQNFLTNQNAAALVSDLLLQDPSTGGGVGGGTVTSVGLTSTGGTVTITGTNPITGSGTMNLEVGGIHKVTLTDAAAIAPASVGFTEFTLQTTSAVGASRTMAVPTGAAQGDIINFEIIQPASGGPCAIVWAAGYVWGVGGQSSAPSGSIVASTSDFYSGYVNASGQIHITQIGQPGPTGATGPAGPAGGVGAAVNFRLTLTSGVPVTTNDVTGATTIFCSPYGGNTILLWDGAAWTSFLSAEFSLALGTKTSGLPYDVFCRQVAGVPTLDDLAWSSISARATAVTFQDGILCKSGDKTRRYLGTYYTTSTTTTADSGGGTTTQVGGQRFLWNYYNRVQRFAKVKDTTATWLYNTNTIRQANAAAGNKVEMVVGFTEDAVIGNVLANVEQLSGTTTSCVAGPGLDSTTAFSNDLQGGIFEASGSASDFAITSVFNELLAPGYHFISWNERGGNGTVTWVGSSQNRQSGMSVNLWS